MCNENRFIQLFILLFALSSPALGVLLSDAEMYFDPDDAAPDYYPRIYLPNLSTDNDQMWLSSGNPVVDADVLPLLKKNIYPPGYVYSQSDYLHLPNVDYIADITAGDLACTFYAPGLYHVRVTRINGLSTIYAVFAETGIMEKEKAEKTSKSKKIDLPQGDLFLAENSDSTVDDAAEILKKGGREVERVDSRQEVIDKIKAKSQALGRKIHAELVGHGTNGNISTGAGKQNIADKQIDLNSVEAFQKEIDDYVDHITIQGCNVGAGSDGEKFLKILSDSIGKSGAYDSSLIVVNKSHFALPVGGTWVEHATLDKGAHNFDPTTAHTPLGTPITWDYGTDAAGYEVYISQIENQVTAREPSALAATTFDNMHYPGILQLGQTYYYAVDSFGGVEPYFSDTWKFTVQQEVIVDNFDYQTSNELNENWPASPGSFAVVANDMRTVDQNSMKLIYDNSVEMVSGVSRQFQYPQNWLDGAAENFNIWLQSSDIRPEDIVSIQIYDNFNGFAVVEIQAIEILHAGQEGKSFSIPLPMLPGLNLTNVSRIAVTVGNPAWPCPPGECQGSLLIDDIGLTGAECAALQADLDGSGIVDINDFAIMASQWLEVGC